MSQAHHHELHLKSTDAVRDVVIGMSDGLTVPFALAAGLSGANVSTKVVVLAGLAEIAAGCIAMGLGGYLAARTDAEHYEHELRRETDEARDMPEEETAEVMRVFQGWGLSDEQVEPLVASIVSDRERWIQFMMRFELGLEEPHPRRAVVSAVTIGLSYVAGGLIPLAPYFVAATLHEGFLWSIGVTLVALAVFGCVKARFTGIPLWKGGFQTVSIGGLAAGTAFLIARSFR